MIEEFVRLLAALTTLSPGQFLLFLLSLAASICSGFSVQTQHRFMGLPLSALATIIWCGGWSAMPNALLKWYDQLCIRLSIPLV